MNAGERSHFRTKKKETSGNLGQKHKFFDNNGPRIYCGSQLFSHNKYNLGQHPGFCTMEGRYFIITLLPPCVTEILSVRDLATLPPPYIGQMTLKL